MLTTRRHFLAGLSTAAAATWIQPLRAAAGDPPSPFDVGHGRFRYRANKNWVPPGQGRNHPILNCHEMVQVRDGRLFMIGDHPDHQMLIFKPDGTILESWGSVWPGGHGLTLADENGAEFLFVTDSGLRKTGTGAYRQTGRVTKIDLTGREIFSLSHPATVGAYEPKMPFNPTETAVAPNGDIYIADGYGSNFVLRYDRNGKFIARFGGNAGVPAEQRLNSAHGIAVDLRAGADNATLLVTSRNDLCFRRFSLDGRYLETLSVPGCNVCRPVISGQELYAGVCWSKDPVASKLPGNPSGFTVILDSAGKVISAPGGTEPVYVDGKLTPLTRGQPIIDHGHDVCVLTNGDMIVCQWNAFQTYPVYLTRLA
jgi:peptidylglycine monooxygenase